MKRRFLGVVVTYPQSVIKLVTAQLLPTPPDITESLVVAPISRTREKRLDLLWVGSQLSKVLGRTRIRF